MDISENTTVNISSLTTEAPSSSPLPREFVKVWIYSVGLFVVIIVGSIGNVLNIIVLWKSRRMNKPSFIYVRWLAVVDLLVNIAAFTGYVLIRSRLVKQTKAALWYYSHIFFFTFRYFVCVSNYILLALTVERFLRIRFPLRFQHHQGKRTSGAILAAIFVSCILLVLPHSYETVVVPYVDVDTNETLYTWNWNDDIHDRVFYRLVYPWMKELLIRFIPIIVVLILNVIIIR